MGESRKLRRLRAQLRRVEGTALQNPDAAQPVGVQALQSIQAVQISMGPLPTPQDLGGGVIALAAITGGIYLIANDKPVSGLVSILGTLAALVSVFVIGRWKQVTELAEKRAVEILEQRSSPKTGAVRR